MEGNYMFKKILGKFFGVASILLLSSCSVLINNDQPLIYSRFTTTISALESNDRDALRNMFSKYILDSPDVDLESGIDAIFDFFEGNIISYDDSKSPHERTESGYGKIIDKRISTWFSVLTDVNEYKIYFEEQVICTKDENRVGLLLIEIKLVDNEESFHGGEGIIVRR